MDKVHRCMCVCGMARVANNCELSGNHPKNVTSEAFGRIGCSTPVDRRRRYAPVLSEYARYLPSGEIAEVTIPFSLAFVVKCCNVIKACDDFDRDAFRHSNHPVATLARTAIASTA